MKIIRSKKQNEALARLGALYAMARHATIKGVKEENTLEYMDKLIGNAAELAFIIGGREHRRRPMSPRERFLERRRK